MSKLMVVDQRRPPWPYPYGYYPYIIDKNGIITEIFPNFLFISGDVPSGVRNRNYNLYINGETIMSQVNMYSFTGGNATVALPYHPTKAQVIKTHYNVKKGDLITSSREFATVMMTLVDKVVNINDYNKTFIYSLPFDENIPGGRVSKHSDKLIVPFDGCLYYISINMMDSSGLEPPGLDITVKHNNNTIIGSDGISRFFGPPHYASVIPPYYCKGLTIEPPAQQPDITIMEKVNKGDIIETNISVINIFGALLREVTQISFVFIYND